jgi:RimJ/RimL family protein N-acetyltransferase
MISGERVRLRRIERDDLPRVAAWLNDAAVRDGLAMIYPLSLVNEEDWFDAQRNVEPARQSFVVEAQDAAESPVPVGIAGLPEIDWRNRVGEYGIFLGERALWGRGYGLDATRTIVRWAFDELNLHRVQLKVFEDNQRAIRCYERAGFVVEGRLRESRFHRGRYWDTLVMAVLRAEP